MGRASESGSLIRQTLAQVALRFVIVAAVAAVLSYYHVLHGLRSQALEQLERYATQRGLLESEHFRLAEDNLQAFAEAYARGLEAADATDPQARFAELFESQADGTLRLPSRVFKSQQITGLVGKFVEVDADLRRQLVLGLDLLGRYGPAWANRFVNLYLTTSESAVLMYWPGRAWALDANSWEVQAKLPTTGDDAVPVADGQGAEATWSRPYFDYAVNDWVVSAAVRVDLQGGRAIFVAHDILLHDLIERTVQGWLPGTYNLVFTEDGELIAHPELMDTIRARGGRFSIPESGDAELRRVFALSSEGGSSRAIIADPEGSVYLAAARLEGPGWYLVTVFPETLVSGRAFATARLVLLLGAIALALELLVLWLVLRHQVFRPLTQLTGATARVGAGDYQVRLDETPANELGRLAQSFNLMSAEICRTVERLKETTVSRSYLDSIIQNTGEGIITLDERGFITSTNPAAEETFRVQRGQLLGMHAMLLLDDAITDPFLDATSYDDQRDGPFTETGAAHTVELAARRWDGRPFPMELVVTQTELEGRALRICILRDVSERKRAEEALLQAKDSAEAASRAKSEFLANMSHELRTPLNSVLGYAQILQRQAELPAQHQRSLARIRQSGEHLLGLIDEVLDLSKVEAGTLELQPGPLELPGLLQSVGEGLQGRAAQKGLELHLAWPPETPRVVVGDERRLRQVLTNLLDNAIKYTRAGRVSLRLAREQDRLRFEVEDTGIGIEGGQLAAIFDPFHQVHNPGSFRDGAGLGLAICRRLVRLMGGELQVASRPGAGSRFWFDLSLPATDVTAVADERGGPRLLGVWGEGRRVLIADDREDNRSLLREMLTPFGFLLREVGDGEACIYEALAWRPDAMLVDLRMPILDGEAVIRRAREKESLRNTLLIGVSASVFGVDRKQCIEAGADAFLPKPVQVDRLLGLLHRHLGLEPIYAAVEAPHPSDESQDSPAPSVALPADRWETLSELARRGDIQGLRAEAQRLAAADASHRAFAAELGTLAEGFQVRKIRELLERTPHE